MSRGGRLVGGVVLVASLAAASNAGAESSIVLPRPGQVGVSIQGGYGLLLESGNLGKELSADSRYPGFGAGPTYSIRLRYRMRYERGIGLSFESQSLDARREPPAAVVGNESTVGPERLSLITSGAEFYQLFGTRERTVKMLMVGAGLAQMRARMNNGDTELSSDVSGDGLFVSGGAGLEHFFFRSWAFDLSARYFTVFHKGKANHDVQSALGVIFYAGL
jgi:hypothetical protein